MLEHKTTANKNIDSIDVTACNHLAEVEPKWNNLSSAKRRRNYVKFPLKVSTTHTSKRDD